MTAIVHDHPDPTPDRDGGTCDPDAVLDAIAALDIEVTPGPWPSTVRVRISGEIDFDNATVLREDLLAALVSHRATLLVDLGEVTFCDCAGLNALLAARATARRAGRRLRIVAAGRRVERLLDLTSTRDLLA
ncbi:STAS domain-containing protein [Streptomyces sp. NPDC048606]|uniref:STAS domain-containing protein n=1 Tax=Streptomyces sp. NPDC048606 TaxID=3154726 RepID=UPI003449CD91